MMRQAVTGSSAVLSMGYEDGVLEVERPNGDVYQYTGLPVTAVAVEGILNAASVGRALNELQRSFGVSIVKVDG